MSLLKAIKIQKWIDEEYGIDIASFTSSDLEFLAKELNKFIATGVDTDDLMPVDEYMSDDEINLEE